MKLHEKTNNNFLIAKSTFLLVFFLFSLFKGFSQLDKLNKKNPRLSISSSSKYSKINCDDFEVTYKEVVKNIIVPSNQIPNKRIKGVTGFIFPNQLNISEDGWMSVKVGLSRRRAFGLSVPSNNKNTRTISYGFFLKNYSQTAVILEQGNSINEIKIKKGDQLTVSKKDGKIVYEHNGKNIRTISIKRKEKLSAKVWLLGEKSFFEHMSMSFCDKEIMSPVAKCRGDEKLIFEKLENTEIVDNQIRGQNKLQGFFQTNNKLKPNEDGWVCLNINDSRRKSIGFSSPNNKLQDEIEYGFLFKNYTSTAQIIESGKVKKTIKIKTNDQFRIERQSEFILYFHNGIRLRKIRTDTNRTLSITGWVMTKEGYFDLDKIFTNVTGGDDKLVCNGIDVVYTDLVNASVSGTIVQYQQIPPNDSQYGGFASTNKIPAGEDGYFCFKIVAPVEVKSIGLSSVNENQFAATIDYSFYFKDFSIRESNINVGSFSPNIGDILKIERVGNEIKYYENTNLIRTVNTDPTQSLILDGFFISDEYFKDVKMSHAPPRNCEVIILPDTLITYCQGNEIQLSLVPSTYVYRWTPSNGLSCSDCPNPIISDAYGNIEDFYSFKVFYSEQDLEEDNHCWWGHLRVNYEENCDDEIIGCCFSNFGTNVTVNQGTYVNVYCNLLNEVGMTNGILQKGEFENEGYIRVLLDWINNGYNDLFISQNGVSELFGNYQQMRGNSSTHYFDLILSGNDKKEIKLDEYAHGVLNLTDRELVIGDFVFFVEDDTPNAIQQTSGFASTDGVGYLSRNINVGNNYHYPLGSTNGTFRVRPLELYNTSLTGRFQIGFINRDPAIDGLINIAPNVLSINDSYYHRIKAPATSADIGIRSFFNKPLEGDFQSLSHLETLTPFVGMTLPLPYWESTPIATVYPPNVSGLDFLESWGTHDFEGEPFVLAQSGFYVNTDNFGDDGNTGSGSTGTTITINPINGNNATGGGIGQPNGTDDGNTTVAPNSLPGDYEIDIATGGASEPGDITFTVGTDGTIDETTITYVDEQTGESGQLSPDLVDVDNTGTGIILNDTPPELDFDCTSSISVKMGTTNPFVLTQSLSENIIIDGIQSSLISVITFEVFDKNQTSSFGQLSYNIANTSLIIPNNNLSGLTPGAYSFEIRLTTSGGQEEIEGQFMVQ